MERNRMMSLTEDALATWNTQNVEAVLACYTNDLTYRDPSTHGDIHGTDAMRRYLTKLFSKWMMHWSIRKVYPLDRENGVALLWRASFRIKNKVKTVEVDGMDLMLFEGERIQRNDVYFDRTILAPLTTH